LMVVCNAQDPAGILSGLLWLSAKIRNEL
jgi:hypothetical protein